MTPRVVRASALVIVVSLFGGPAVGIACSLWCESGHHGGSAAAHHDMGHSASASGVRAAHTCDHQFDTVQLYMPKSDTTVQCPESVQVVVASLLTSQERPLAVSRVTHLGPPGESTLPSIVPLLVLRI